MLIDIIKEFVLFVLVYVQFGVGDGGVCYCILLLRYNFIVVDLLVVDVVVVCVGIYYFCSGLVLNVCLCGFVFIVGVGFYFVVGLVFICYWRLY